MTIDAGRGSAKIYQFPARVRQAVDRGEPGRRPDPMASRFVECGIGGGAWYHDAAIRAAEPGRKR